MATIAFPKHAAIDGFDVVGDELAISATPLSELARRAGQTPFYAYSRAAIEARVLALRTALPSALHLHYAIKANPMPEVVSLFASLTDGLDVASAGEMALALAAGATPASVSFAGPGKTEGEIEAAVRAGVTINLESERQLELALAAGNRLGVEPSLAIRVNPTFELKASGMKMGGGAKPFGIDEERVPTAAARIEAAGLKLRGFHVFTGSQNLSASALVEAQTLAVALGARLAAPLASGVDWLNIGGGFGVPYFPGEQSLDLAPIAANFEVLCESARRDLGAPLVLELGRYLVADAGVYVCRVLDRKVSQGQIFLVTDGGMHHHLAASGNFGQVIRKNYPLAVGTRMKAIDREVQSVVGPLCTPLDLLGDRVELPPADIDDLIVVFRSGAYGASASPWGFLSHPAPVEILA